MNALRLRLFPAHLLPDLHRRVVHVRGAWLIPGSFNLGGKELLVALTPPASEPGWACPCTRDAAEEDLDAIEAHILSETLDGREEVASAAGIWFMHLASARLRAFLDAEGPGALVPHERVYRLVAVLETDIRRTHDKVRADLEAEQRRGVLPC